MVRALLGRLTAERGTGDHAIGQIAQVAPIRDVLCSSGLVDGLRRLSSLLRLSNFLRLSDHNLGTFVGLSATARTMTVSGL